MFLWQPIVATKVEFTWAQAGGKFCLVETKEIPGIFWLPAIYSVRTAVT